MHTHDDEHGRPFTWDCPPPAQLPERRGKLLSWLAERGAGFYADCLALGSQQVRPPGDLTSSAARLAAEEYHRVAGELYWVSEEMTELARHAGSQLTHYELYDHDLPSTRGFMVFAAPLGTANEHGQSVEIVAASWGKIQPPLLIRDGAFELPIGSNWAQGAVWFTFYSDPHGYITALAADDHLAAAQRRAVGPFMPDNELIWPIGTLEELPERRDTTAEWGTTVLAAWLIMRQPLAATSTERPPRPARRRLDKANLPTNDVRLIHIRRPQRPTTTPHPESAGRTYSHRWWVRGHWRRVHVGPGRARIERRWINPYIAGPDDKPVRGTQRVQVWDR